MTSAVRQDQIDQLAEQYSDQFTRLNTLYAITDKEGRHIPFRMNLAQTDFYNRMWFRNVVLKSRQHGFTTGIDIFALDTAIFTPNTNVGIIAHTKDDADEIFKSKIKYPYEHLPAEIRSAVTAKTDRVGQLTFSNGSSVRVSTSFRSGTLQILHISEMGKIAARYPEKAREIMTGAMEAVGKGMMVFVESTAEGRSGWFYTLCSRAQAQMQQGKQLGEMDFQFYFRAWWQDPRNTLDETAAVLTQELQEYFEHLKARGIHLTHGQKLWYAAKFELLEDDIYREHPSTPEEAFKATIEGAYYGATISKMRRQKRIGRFPYDPMLPVETYWDLGLNDSMSIWFAQVRGPERVLIDYYENSGEWIGFYVKHLQNKEYVYSRHCMPHDIAQRTMLMPGAPSRIEIAEQLGLHPIDKALRPKNSEQLANQIDQTRAFLRTCYIDEENCANGIVHLENYRKKWDEVNAEFKSSPVHNAACHAADALRTGAVLAESAPEPNETVWFPQREQVFEPEYFHDS